MTAERTKAYTLPIDVPHWKHRLHRRALRAARLLELNAPAGLILNEILQMNKILFQQVHIDVTVKHKGVIIWTQKAL